jgi:hypothetical protein
VDTHEPFLLPPGFFAASWPRSLATAEDASRGKIPMSTKYEPQLNHIGFDWYRQSKRFHRDLLARETVVLGKLGSGFNEVAS